MGKGHIVYVRLYHSTWHNWSCQWNQILDYINQQ